MANVPRTVWWLPRPRPDHYKGGFPLGFEHGLLRLLGLLHNGKPLPGTRILHPFGGMSQFGERCDLNPETKPHHLQDAHCLPPEWTDIYDLVILDPPYSDKESKEIYGMPPLHPKIFTAEAVRVCRPGGYVVCYHRHLCPRPPGCAWHHLIVVVTRVYHAARVVGVFRKLPPEAVQVKPAARLGFGLGGKP